MVRSFGEWMAKPRRDKSLIELYNKAGWYIVALGALGLWAAMQKGCDDVKEKKFREAFPIVNTLDSLCKAKTDSINNAYIIQIDSLRKVYDLENKDWREDEDGKQK